MIPVTGISPMVIAGMAQHSVLLAKSSRPVPVLSAYLSNPVVSCVPAMLEVACRKCERRGRLSIARLIAQYGRDDHSDLCALIAHDCPRMHNPAVSIYERCGVHFPELPRWFFSR